MKTNLFNTNYSAPVVKVVEVEAEGVLCGSGFGDEGKAGANGRYTGDWAKDENKF